MEMQQISGFYFDTYNTITAACDPALLEKAMDACARYERVFSKTIEGSEVWQLNHASGEPVTVSEDVRRVLAASLELYRASGGAFNVAVGRLMALWNFKSRTPALPEESALQTALEASDAGCITLEGNEARLPAGMEIDLGGIAKGYIADRVAELLREGGAETALLNFGGNIVTTAPKPDGSPWRIGLQSPGGAWGEDYWAVTELGAGTVVTSGVYERGFELGGKRYHHILDPRTGYPAESGLLSVTIRGSESMTADGLATAALVLGAEKGIALASRFGCQAIALCEDDRVLRSRDFPLLQ